MSAVALGVHQIDDLVSQTKPNYHKEGEWNDLSLSLNNYRFAPLVMKGKGMDGVEKKIHVQSGTEIVFPIQYRNNKTARLTGLYDEDKYATGPLMKKGKMGWSLSTFNWTYDVGEDEFQQGPAAITRLLRVRRHSAMNDFVDFFERQMWGAPTSPDENKPPISGIRFWVQKYMVGGVPAEVTLGKNGIGGFAGGDPAGFPGGAAGIKTSEVPNWKNYTFTYSAVTRDDLFEKIAEAQYRTQFVSPDNYADATKGNPRWAMYTTGEVVRKAAKVAEARNDDLGVDIANYLGKVLVNRIPLTRVDYLDEIEDEHQPVYGIDWATMHYYAKTGRDMFEHPPIVIPNQHNMRAVHVDHACNLACFNRRGQFVGYLKP